MSVLIKGIKMPKNIEDSLLFTICDGKAICISNCSEYEVIEVPTPHGRLIDGFKLEDVLEWLKKVTNESSIIEQAQYKTLMDFSNRVYNMPTIIEEEEGDDEQIH